MKLHSSVNLLPQFIYIYSWSFGPGDMRNPPDSDSPILGEILNRKAEEGAAHCVPAQTVMPTIRHADRADPATEICFSRRTAGLTFLWRCRCRRGGVHRPVGCVQVHYHGLAEEPQPPEPRPPHAPERGRAGAVVF